MKFLEKLKGIDKNHIKVVISVAGGIFLGVIFAPPCSIPSHEGINDKVATLELEKTENTNTIESQNATIKDLESKVSELETKVDSAQPWFTMKKEEQKKIEEANKKAEAEKQAKFEAERKREEEEQKKKEEAERKAAEEKEKNKYNTGITYDNLARSPEQYKGEYVKFKGKVLQVLEDSGVTQIRLAIDGDYDKVILVGYSSSILDVKLLEGDVVTVYGESQGDVTYTSTIGKPITLPLVLTNKIDM